jgi:hypothetical protein
VLSGVRTLLYPPVTARSGHLVRSLRLVVLRL